MAPFMGPSRAKVLAILRSASAGAQLPLTLGRYQPQAVIQREGSTWVLRPLVLDEERARKAGEEALARSETWMPEMTWQFLAPGPAVLSSGSKSDFIARLEALEWAYGPDDASR